MGVICRNACLWYSQFLDGRPVVNQLACGLKDRCAETRAGRSGCCGPLHAQAAIN